MNREILITSKTTSASVDEFLAKVLKAAATSVRSIGSKCFLSFFFTLENCPCFSSTQIYVVPSFLEEGIL